MRASLSDEQQKEEVKRQARAWIGRQPLISGERILIAGYETNRLDSSLPIQYNKLEFNDAGEPEAVIHSLLMAGHLPFMY